MIIQKMNAYWKLHNKIAGDHLISCKLSEIASPKTDFVA